jgi:hypothetical protein
MILDRVVAWSSGRMIAVEPNHGGGGCSSCGWWLVVGGDDLWMLLFEGGWSK